MFVPSLRPGNGMVSATSFGSSCWQQLLASLQLRSNATRLWSLEIRFPILSSDEHGGLLNQAVEQRLPQVLVARVLESKLPWKLNFQSWCRIFANFTNSRSRISDSNCSDKLLLSWPFCDRCLRKSFIQPTASDFGGPRLPMPFTRRGGAS